MNFAIRIEKGTTDIFLKRIGNNPEDISEKIKLEFGVSIKQITTFLMNSENCSEPAKSLFTNCPF
jgi:hypothetical protein